MSRADWLEWRRAGIGASDVAAILGLSPWASPWSVWAEKVGVAPADDHETATMEFGRRFEPCAAPWFHELTGLHVVGQQTWLMHPVDPWKRATPDGFVAESRSYADTLGTFEIKTTRDSPKKWENDGIPVYYQCQAAWQCHVSGLPRTWFGVLHPFGQFRVYAYEPPADDTALVVERVTAFWTDHVLGKVPPPVDEHTATTAALNRAWPVVDPDSCVDADDDLVSIVREIDALKRHIRADERRVEALANHVKARLADRTELTADGTLIASWRRADRTDIDRKAVRRDHGDAYDTTTRVRRFLTHLPDIREQPA